jgi:hypothetical protein
VSDYYTRYRRQFTVYAPPVPRQEVRELQRCLVFLDSMLAQALPWQQRAQALKHRLIFEQRLRDARARGTR